MTRKVSADSAAVEAWLEGSFDKLESSPFSQYLREKDFLNTAIAFDKKQEPATLQNDPNGGIRKLGYRPALDGLRGIAWIAVFLGHVQPFSRLAPADSGMFVFFALSGFLITQLLLAENEREKHVKLFNFIKRRMIRLLPALVAFLLVWFLVVSIFMGSAWLTTVPQGGPGRSFSPALAVEGVLASLTYFMNWVEIYHSFGGYVPIGHIWSLAVEMQFYVVWAVALVLLLRYGKRVALWTALLGAMAANVEAIVLMHSGDAGLRVYMGTDIRAGALLGGATAAILWSYSSCNLKNSKTLSTASWISVGVILWSTYAFTRDTLSVAQQVAWPLDAVACAVVVIYMVEKENGLLARWTRSPWVRYIGKRSYALYLWHYVWLTWFRSLGFVGIVAGLLMSLISAELSFRFVEAPAVRWSKRRSRVAPVFGSEGLMDSLELANS